MTRINVYAQNKGWLFEDLKNHFRNLGGSEQLRVLVSDEPLAEADVWVALRTSEAAVSPDISRTVVCIHDLFYEDGMYGARGSRGCVGDAGALVLCHPEQRQIVARDGISLIGRSVLERPLGALSAFSPSETNPPVFRIGWVGRNHARKRLDWFVDAAKALPLPVAQFEIVLIGEGLVDAASTLYANGVQVSHYDREFFGIEEYPQLYRELDCAVITSSTEAGPLPLFEALASGLVVISTPVGWAPHFAAGSPRYVRLANSVTEIVDHLTTLNLERTAVALEKFQVSRLVSKWTLETWIHDVAELGATLNVRQTSVCHIPTTSEDVKEIIHPVGGWDVYRSGS